jgi:hypothetical protein
VRCFILRDLYKVVVEDLVEASHRKLCFGKVCKPATVEATFQILENEDIAALGDCSSIFSPRILAL